MSTSTVVLLHPVSTFTVRSVLGSAVKSSEFFIGNDGGCGLLIFDHDSFPATWGFLRTDIRPSCCGHSCRAFSLVIHISVPTSSSGSKGGFLWWKVAEGFQTRQMECVLWCSLRFLRCCHSRSASHRGNGSPSPLWATIQGEQNSLQKSLWRLRFSWFSLRRVLVVKIVTWLILPVVICLSQRLSHACLSISNLYGETANGSLNQLSFI